MKALEGGSGKISGAQQEFNILVGKKLEELKTDVDKLKRIDFRLNQELVSKPYAYIDKIKENLIKEQAEL
jgi:hypothetical protein